MVDSDTVATIELKGVWHLKLAIMQPYYFPYLGYFQLMGAVDKFVILDDVQFIKGGWIHRNRILLEGTRNRLI